MKTFLLGIIISCVVGVVIRKYPKQWAVWTAMAISAGLCFAYYFMNQI